MIHCWFWSFPGICIKKSREYHLTFKYVSHHLLEEPAVSDVIKGIIETVVFVLQYFYFAAMSELERR